MSARAVHIWKSDRLTVCGRPAANFPTLMPDSYIHDQGAVVTKPRRLRLCHVCRSNAEPERLEQLLQVMSARGGLAYV